MLRLDPLGEAVGAARRYVRGELARLGRPELEDSAVLAVSELVTNATIHARTPLTVVVTVEDRGTVRVTVRDFSPAPPSVRRYGVEATTGRGLRLVESVSSAWGVDEVPRDQGGGKAVWFEPSGDMTDSGFAERNWLADLEGE